MGQNNVHPIRPGFVQIMYKRGIIFAPYANFYEKTSVCFQLKKSIDSLPLVYPILPVSCYYILYFAYLIPVYTLANNFCVHQ